MSSNAFNLVGCDFFLQKLLKLFQALKMMPREEAWGNTVVVLWPLVNGAADLVLALASQISVWFNWPWAPVQGSLTWTLLSCLMAWGLAAKLSGQLRFLTFWLFLVRIWSCNEVQPLLSWKFPVSAPFHLHLLHWLLTGHSLHETTVKIRIRGDSLGMKKKPIINKQTLGVEQLGTMDLVIPCHFLCSAHFIFFPRKC